MNLSNVKNTVKIPLIMVILAIINAGVISLVALKNADDMATSMTEEKIAAIEGGVATNLEDYLRSIQEDIVINADSAYVRQALRSFRGAWEDLKASDKAAYLQKAYIDDNPSPTGSKHLLDAAKDGTLYSIVHSKIHPWFRKLLEERGYYDIFIFDERGNLLYTVFKELDYATNMHTGSWKDTDLANLYLAVKNDPEKDKIQFFDFAPYEPSHGVPAAFIGAPILDEGGKFIGVLAFQMPIERINKLGVVNKETSETAQVRLIGPDFLLRNDPDSSDDVDPILQEKFDAPAVKAAFDGKTIVSLSDLGDKSILTAASIVHVFDKEWVAAVSIDEDEAMKDVRAMGKSIVLSSLAILVVLTILSTLYSRTITTPIVRLMEAMRQLADRNYSIDIPFVKRGDEMGDMARTVGIFKENGLAIQKLEQEQKELELRSEREKHEAMGKLADDFDRRTAGIIKSLAAAATEMQATAQQMSSVSGNTTHASQIVAAAASEADNNVQVVAAATEELSASSREIAQQISNVAHKSSRAASEAERTSQQVNELNTLADSIGDVISSIKAIAEQTNLLALNATIEAARAGEAGKGFAVVADEVKKLATETASKTIEIDERVGRIQDAIRSSVEAVGRIINDVQEIDHATSAVAGAVEEQNAATAEIGRNVNEASQGTQQVAQNIHDVQRNAEETGDSARALNDAASELAEIAESLQNQVTEFLHEIRSS
ncbi:MAG: methyl-accepting chemotaxis protein [Alphaproteobacteria bacterium]|nr:methyl-accepting chemotaxis protein [Alphaproteobacteria bacterium]